MIHKTSMGQLFVHFFHFLCIDFQEEIFFLTEINVSSLLKIILF